jgi:hypothetical protein
VVDSLDPSAFRGRGFLNYNRAWCLASASSTTPDLLSCG